MRVSDPMWVVRAATALTLGLAVTACSTPAAPPTTAPETAATPEAMATQPAVATTEATAAPTVHWTYEGEEGPAKWAELSPAFEACGAGTTQSPIDLAKPAMQDLTNIKFNYQPSKVNIVNNGHTVQVNYDPGSYIELDGTRYDLAQFHFHAPSEHSVDGKLADAEVHLVHKSADGQLAVVGVLIKTGAENPAFTTVAANIPATAGPAQSVDAMVNAANMLPETQATYRYTGSLTTPPCTEGVHWNVMATPIEMSAAQLATLTAVMHANNRPVQDLKGRTLVEDSTP
jgi:carbonic anhydrase